MPLSDKIKAPAQSDCSLLSLLTVTVNPLVDVAVALTYILCGSNSTANLSS